MKKKIYQDIKIVLFSSKTYFIEISIFLFVMLFLIFPSILLNHALILPEKPKTLQDTSFFLLKIFILAMFEELIYRVYLPIQMTYFYTLKNKDCVQSKNREKKVFHIISNIFFASSHLYLSVFNVFFAFVIGIFFSLIYEYAKEKLNVYCALFIISLLHFFYNSVAFFALIY